MVVKKKHTYTKKNTNLIMERQHDLKIDQEFV